MTWHYYTMWYHITQSIFARSSVTSRFVYSKCEYLIWYDITQSIFLNQLSTIWVAHSKFVSI